MEKVLMKGRESSRLWSKRKQLPECVKVYTRGCWMILPLVQNQSYPCRRARPLFLGRVPFAVSYYVGLEFWMVLWPLVGFHGGFVVYPNIFAARRVYHVKNGVWDENRDVGTPWDCSHDTYGLGGSGKSFAALIPSHQRRWTERT